MSDKERALVEAIHRQAAERLRGQPQPTVESKPTHFTQLPEAEPGSPLGQEWNTYRREVGRLLAEGQEGKHVLIKGTEIIGIYDTWEAARAAGLQRYLLAPFFVHAIRAEEPFLRLRGINLPWPSLPSP